MKRRSKYGAIPTVVDGIRFASKREAKRWCELKLMENAGEIENLKRQPGYPFWINGVLVTTYRADFSYWTKKGEVIEDSKGMRTKEYVIKRKLMKAVYGIEVVEV